MAEDKTACEGYHQFREPSYNGYMLFEVYKRNEFFYWSEYDDWSNAHVGFENGPFDTSTEAYRDALKLNSVFE